MEDELEYDVAFREGMTFQQFVERAESNEELWRSLAGRAPLHAEAASRIATLPGHWRLLVLAEDWCGDALNTVPVVARLADAVENLDLRIVRRDEHPALMDLHLTNGARSIPVVIALDEEGRARGWWGPRPGALQAWFEREGRAMPKAVRYRELRRWYARDRGATTAAEIADVLWCGAGVGERPYAGSRPCEGVEAAIG